MCVCSPPAVPGCFLPSSSHTEVLPPHPASRRLIPLRTKKKGFECALRNNNSPQTLEGKTTRGKCMPVDAVPTGRQRSALLLDSPSVPAWNTSTIVLAGHSGWPGMSAKARRATADATRILWTMTVANYCLTVDSASSAFLAIDATLPGGVSASAMTTSLASGDRRWLLSKFVSAPLHCSRLVMSLPFLLRV